MKDKIKSQIVITEITHPQITFSITKIKLCPNVLNMLTEKYISFSLIIVNN